MVDVVVDHQHLVMGLIHQPGGGGEMCHPVLPLKNVRLIVQKSQHDLSIFFFLLVEGLVGKKILFQTHFLLFLS